MRNCLRIYLLVSNKLQLTKKNNFSMIRNILNLIFIVYAALRLQYSYFVTFKLIIKIMHVGFNYYFRNRKLTTK